METKKAPVGERAILARIRRKLKADGSVLKSCSTRSRWHGDLGDFYIVGDNNVVTACHLDLESLAREIGVLKPYEEIARD